MSWWSGRCITLSEMAELSDADLEAYLWNCWKSARKSYAAEGKNAKVLWAMYKRNLEFIAKHRGVSIDPSKWQKPIEPDPEQLSLF